MRDVVSDAGEERRREGRGARWRGGGCTVYVLGMKRSSKGYLAGKGMESL